MSRIISIRDVKEMVRNGQDIKTIPSDAIITPSARDYIFEIESNGGAPQMGTPKSNGSSSSNNGSPSADGKLSPPSRPPNSKSSKSELEAFFYSPYAHSLKQQICEMGRRLWERAYVDGNGGNMAIRVGEDIAICTPTLVSKGSLKPEDMCLVDFQGNQLCGTKKRTSEILMHLQIMQKQPQAVATCHCHPPYATGFAVAGIVPPTCMVPEYEVFVSVGIAPYRTPGTPEMGKLVSELVGQYNTVLMANHGVVSWSHNNIEEAYWRMEIVEAYCRTLLVTAQLGKAPNTFTPEQLKDLLKIKQSLGYVDPRIGMKECELCDNSEWRPGVACGINTTAKTTVGLDAEAEEAVKAITDQILAKIK
ncbi:MAG TPA: class II aldolase/adducin family protein [Pseudomonadales bacterium]|nr:class II aldolase/adducin family protein [Pseudomonadales bacterium]